MTQTTQMDRTTPEGLRLIAAEKEHPRFIALQAMSYTLIRDANVCAALLEGNFPNQFARRAFVRAMFALVEGVTFGMKSLIVGDDSSQSDTLSEQEKYLLREVTYDLDENGTPKAKPMILQNLPNVRFAFATFSKFFGIENVLEVGGTGWESFRLAAKARNRLMHPKSSDDLFIDDDTFARVLKGYNWYATAVVNAWKAVGEAAEEYLTDAEVDAFVSALETTMAAYPEESKAAAPEQP